MDLKKLTAPCGLACFACSMYKDNITDAGSADRWDVRDGR